MSPFLSLFAFMAFGYSASPIKPDEVVVFFPTVGHQVEDGRGMGTRRSTAGYTSRRSGVSAGLPAIESFRKALGLREWRRSIFHLPAASPSVPGRQRACQGHLDSPGRGGI